MNIIDLSFPVFLQSTLPVDHGYVLYPALSRVLPELRESNGIAFHSIRGHQLGNCQLQLAEHSRLVIRTSAERIPALIQLAGKQLKALEADVLVGVPHVLGLGRRLRPIVMDGVARDRSGFLVRHRMKGFNRVVCVLVAKRRRHKGRGFNPGRMSRTYPKKPLRGEGGLFP